MTGNSGVAEDRNTAPNSARSSRHPVIPSSRHPVTRSNKMTNEPPPTPRDAPPAGKKFPCVKCGARLDFDPSARSLKCPYCGHVEEINPEKKTVEEHDFEEYLRRHSGESTVAGRASQVKCNTCGAVVLLEDRVASDRCPYCASFIENKPEAAQAMVLPECITP